ncbi:hypothetical protein BKI52_23190 [marine bacterium AO1-C]|nr:hypothetical protein BKI52_23190 [marine bacterium AO1-C]
MKQIHRLVQRLFFIVGWFFLGLFITQCSSHQVTPTFYYWKTTFELSDKERDYLTKLQVKKLYIRYFDVDWNPHRKEAVPVKEIRWKTQALPPLQIIPTVFITNRTLFNISYNQLEKLGNNIAIKIVAKSKGLPNVQINEVQLDCDWSGKTRERFFKLIEILKIKLKNQGIKHISATIRLHQVKYFKKTGVPPVDRGMLMFYNMGNLDGSNTKNSILDLEIARRYLVKPGKYPLQLDVALPIYQWGVVVRRGRVVELLNNLKNNTFANRRFFRPKGKNELEVTQSTYIGSFYAYKGDVIRLEQVTTKQLKQSAWLLRRFIKNNAMDVAFFHLDENTLSNYQFENLQEIYQIF